MFPWNRALTNYDILDVIKKTEIISIFKGIFSRDEIQSLNDPSSIECGIINLSKLYEPGTHWTAYFKVHKNVKYFDSFGDLPPPKELVKYFKGCDIYYNTHCEQHFNTVICGQLCLRFLYVEFMKL